MSTKSFLKDSEVIISIGYDKILIKVISDTLNKMLSSLQRSLTRHERAVT